jgi:hypothetical protein
MAKAASAEALQEAAKKEKDYAKMLLLAKTEVINPSAGEN